jgi:hypothetical protein
MRREDGRERRQSKAANEAAGHGKNLRQSRRKLSHTKQVIIESDGVAMM